MFFYTKIEDKNKTFRVGINRQFSPTPRYIGPLETRLHQPQGPNMFVHKPGEQMPENEAFVPITQQNILLKNVTVEGRKKRRYFTDSDNLFFKNENYGRQWASFYYNIDAELDKIRDKGETEPDIFDFLATKNVLFKKAVSNDQIPCMTYSNKPIQWIVDNGEAGGAITSADSASGDEFFPVDMNEIKSVYIAPYDPGYDTREAAKVAASSEEPGAIGPDYSNHVKIYLYTHRRFTTASNKGIRRTHFQGFNLASTFQMEDYSIMPPMADFRRTIYWNPDVTTDATGKAQVEFYNNSICEEMYISAEGMSSDGKMVVKE